MFDCHWRHMSERFFRSKAKDQDIRTQCALRWNIVVSEWWSVIAESLNFSSGARLIKPAKLYMCIFKVGGITMNKCTSYGLTSSIYDHFITWPSSVTLTFNLREQMFQTALLHFEDNNCAKLFWNPCIMYKLCSGQAQFMIILTFIWPLWP